MELFKEAYFSKSAMLIGKELKHCFNCSYCRANNGQLLEFTKYLPSDLNPAFTRIPVMVNLFYGDPCMQPELTMNLLERLEAAGHVGPVILVTKGDMSVFQKIWRPFNLNIHWGISTFGVNSPFDGSTVERFVKNMNICREMGVQYSIEYRPIIKNINDSDEAFEFVTDIAKEHGVGIGYCGLQVSEDTRKRMLEEGLEFEPYDKTVGFGLKKFISKERDAALREIAAKKGVNVYRKTSCLIATANGTPDYNAHYYRPNEVGCPDCPNKERCSAFKAENDNRVVEDMLSVIPFKFEVVDKKDHVCSLFRSGLCKFPSHDCTHINGKLIKIEQEITTSDVRLIKWLTGYTVDAPFVELPYISKDWVKLENQEDNGQIWNH